MAFFRLALHWQILITMVAGAVLGVILNATAGTFTTPRPIPVQAGALQTYGMADPVEVQRGRVWISDTPSRIAIQYSIREAATGRFRTMRYVVRGPEAIAIDWPDPPPQVDPSGEIPEHAVPAVAELKKKHPAPYALFQLHGRSTARQVADVADMLGGLFLRMLKMVSIPLIITSLITGVTGLGHAERLGKMFGRTLAYYLATSLLAIITGLFFVNLIQPGKRNVPAPPPAAADEADEAAAGEEDADGVSHGPARNGQPAAERQREGKSLTAVLFEQVENMIPDNPIAAAAEGNFLSIIAFSILFAIFTILVGGETGRLIAQFFEAAFEVMMRMTLAIIYLAPFGVLFLMLAATASQGIDVFRSLGWYMFTVACALVFHAVVTLPLILKFVAKRDPREYAKAMSPALLTAFSSASSNGTLPLTMTCAEERAGVSNRVTSFVLPLGATVNMDGTALYEVVAVLFIAQLTPGIELTLAQQIIIAFTALLASIGAAGIPHAGLVMMIIILQAVNLPTESQGLIIAVDRVLDMARTSVNVWSDSCGCAVVSKYEAT